MSRRTFPIRPRRLEDLELGDLIAVPGQPDGWACLQVLGIHPGTTPPPTTFLVGTLRWRGPLPPTRADAVGLPPVARGMVDLSIFEHADLLVVDRCALDAGDDLRAYGPLVVAGWLEEWRWSEAISKARKAAATVRRV